ncbi:spermidine synthase [Methylohalomonas lacus]|uniref:Spermidine synthase n=1 Tax=Methylohalomonas lacus TaxID=398773 RepID=A0AAE3HMS5_9GAMM|nr:methyltransferase domain-containing protein [Methylohalomonas lacus]MCS3904051.1 spermidine synthase [Methylohalomonas lacus]
MAVLWQQQINGNRYEVRSHGRTRRLYTNGVCHSDYHPDRAITRSVWDCLFLPLLFKPPQSIKRVLVLGVGGGSVMHLLRQHLPHAEVIGVDVSAVHLEVAERYFGLRDVELHEADAGDWLQSYEGPTFDAIIDDLFLEEGSDAQRAIEADVDWFRLLLSRVTGDGVLTMNLPDSRACRQCAWSTHKTLQRQLPVAYALRTPLLNNVVGAFPRFRTQAHVMKQHLRQIPALARAQKQGQLRYSMRRLV